MEGVPRILVIEDEIDIQEILKYNLVRNGFAVETAGDGLTGLSKAKENTTDLIVLDLMLPGLDGLEVCRLLRKDSDVPIIMLSAKAEEIEKVVGLEIGADDYLVKPFSIQELMARIRSVLRRSSRLVEASNRSAPDSMLESGNLVVDISSHMVWLQGDEIFLTVREFKLLSFLISNKGKVLTRDQILHNVWGLDYADFSRTLDVHIRWIRSKIDTQPSQASRITTIRGVGYRFDK
jgi:DNA-binding response OmpR family regulator